MQESREDIIAEVEGLKDMLVEFATGGGGDNDEYVEVRQKLRRHPATKDVLPEFVSSCRSLDEFWGFIKPKFGTYAGRREFLRGQFNPLLTKLEDARRAPSRESGEPDTSPRTYYSQRKHGKRIDLPLLKELFLSTYRRLTEGGYFQESIGYYCEGRGAVAGTMGSDVGDFFLRELRKRNIYPFAEHMDSWAEEDLFDVIEVLHDWVSKPTAGYYHDYDDCGHHYTEFDRDAGQVEYREQIKRILADYQGEYELSREGEVLHKADEHLQSLLESPLPGYDPENVDERVSEAVRKFLLRRSSREDRRDAVRSLADVLEFLRPKLKAGMLKRDEAALFEIANGFGIRHHNRQQKTQYEAGIWLTWMFYVYLATIHAVTRVLKRLEAADSSSSDAKDRRPQRARDGRQ